MEHDPYENAESQDEETPTEAEIPQPEAKRDTKKLPVVKTEFAAVDADSGERTMAALAHGSIILTLLTGGFAGWIVPLVIWAVHRDKSRWVADQALQALVFQVATTVVAYILGLLAGGAILISSILIAVLVGLCLLPFALLFGLVAFIFPFAATAYGIFGALETYQGRDFQYWWVGDLLRGA